MEIDLHRVGELRLVATGRCGRQHDPIAFLHVHTRELGVGRERARVRHEGVQSEQLFDRRGDQRGILDDLVTPLGMLGEVEPQPADRGRDRVQTRHEQQVTERADLVMRDRLAVDARRDHPTHEILARLGTTLHYQLVEVRSQLDVRDPLALRSFRVAVHMEDRVVPVEEHLQLILGQTEQFQEDGHREGVRERLDEVTLAFCQHVVDQQIRRGADLALEFTHARGRQRHVQRPPVLRVVRRVHRDRQQSDLAPGYVGYPTGEQIGAPEGLMDVLVARQAPEPTVERTPEDTKRFAQTVPRRHWVPAELLAVPMVELVHQIGRHVIGNRPAALALFRIPVTHGSSPQLSQPALRLTQCI